MRQHNKQLVVVVLLLFLSIEGTVGVPKCSREFFAGNQSTVFHSDPRGWAGHEKVEMKQHCQRTDNVKLFVEERFPKLASFAKEVSGTPFMKAIFEKLSTRPDHALSVMRSHQHIDNLAGVTNFAQIVVLSESSIANQPICGLFHALFLASTAFFAFLFVRRSAWYFKKKVEAVSLSQLKVTQFLGKSLVASVLAFALTNGACAKGLETCQLVTNTAQWGGVAGVVLLVIGAMLHRATVIEKKILESDSRIQQAQALAAVEAQKDVLEQKPVVYTSHHFRIPPVPRSAIEGEIDQSTADQRKIEVDKRKPSEPVAIEGESMDDFLTPLYGNSAGVVFFARLYSDLNSATTAVAIVFMLIAVVSSAILCTPNVTNTCRVGYRSQTMALTNQIGCLFQSCPSHCEASANTGEDASCLCKAGYYGTIRWDNQWTGSCALCEIGKYSSSAGASGCVTCPSGYSSQSKGATQCLECASGSWSRPGRGCVQMSCPTGFVLINGVCACEPGTYSAELITIPQSTYSGTFSIVDVRPVGATCQSCSSSGMVSGPASSTTALVCKQACLAGEYLKTQNGCYGCEVGKFKLTAGNSASCSTCHVCLFPSEQTKTECSTTTDTECECSAGYYGTRTSNYFASGGTGCLACPAGSYTSTTGSAGCTDCVANTYQSETAQSECIACPSGTTSATGATVCT